MTGRGRFTSRTIDCEGYRESCTKAACPPVVAVKGLCLFVSSLDRCVRNLTLSSWTEGRSQGEVIKRNRGVGGNVRVADSDDNDALLKLVLKNGVRRFDAVDERGLLIVG